MNTDTPKKRKFLDRENRFEKHCEREVREWIKYSGGLVECLSWFQSLPKEMRREILRIEWDTKDCYVPHVTYNSHSYEYFLSRIGMTVEKPEQLETPVETPVEAPMEAYAESVGDNNLDFIFI